ncbi:gamma-glutamylcyclotransferase [candidate division CSSED10-310 bacterium]|uniref:Gamma-glutamylcyclotransferase n=1 Tax=candidate division CSSED10-310 bacterium TaxID=2855610 RepID=A0ABV6Z065_UNCC1
MEDYLKFIYENYTTATSFEKYWFSFENYFDHHFPIAGNDDTMRKRAVRFEKHLKQIPVHETFWSRLYGLPEAKNLAELLPRIFREINRDTSAHDAFASDYSRFTRGQKPKKPVARLINLLYTVRCNTQHGQKILPEEWEDIRRRNEKIFALTIPLLAELTELVITQFVVSGLFSYGTLQEAWDADVASNLERHEDLRIKGFLYDMGRFPAWRYNTWGWVHGCVLRAPRLFRLKHISFCDNVEGDQFERRLVLAYDQNEDAQCLVWVYHFSSEPDFTTKIKDGIWRSAKQTDAGDR